MAILVRRRTCLFFNIELIGVDGVVCPILYYVRLVVKLYLTKSNLASYRIGNGRVSTIASIVLLVLYIHTQ